MGQRWGGRELTPCTMAEPFPGEQEQRGAHGHPQPFLPAALPAARAPAMARPLVSPRPALCAYDCLCSSGEGWAPLPSLLALAHTLLHAHTRVRARARSQWAAALHNASPFTPSLAIPAPRDRTGRERAHNFSPSPPPLCLSFLGTVPKVGQNLQVKILQVTKKIRSSSLRAHRTVHTCGRKFRNL